MKNRLILGAGNFQQGTEKYLLYLKYYIDLLEKAYGLMNLKSMQNKRITKVVRTKKRYTRNTKYHKTKQNSLDPSTMLTNNTCLDRLALFLHTLPSFPNIKPLETLLVSFIRTPLYLLAKWSS